MINSDNHNIKEFINDYNHKGTIQISRENGLYPFDNEDLEKLSDYCKNVEKEYIQIGDAGEKNNLMVGRFMTDVDKPQVVENPYSKKVIDILNKKKVKNFIKDILNLQDDFYLRRIQFNQIDKDCFVGYHLDTDSNPDYIAAGVIQMGSKFEGGLYRVYQKDESFFDYKSGYGDLIISNCKYPHEVTKVTEGERKSLVFFVSNHGSKNRRKN